MAEQAHTAAAHFRQRFMAICAAIPAAVVAGLVTVVVLDGLLPHGKDWQLPVIFVSAFIVGGVTGVQCMRRITGMPTAPNQGNTETLDDSCCH